MRTIAYIIQKEFIQLFRNKVLVRVIFLLPIFQLFILAYAATFEIKNIKLHIVDQDKTQTSRELISHFTGSPFYVLTGYSNAYKIAEQEIINSQADQILLIPPDFEKKISINKYAKVQVVNNAIDGSAASLMNAYSTAIVRNFNKNLIVENTGLSDIENPIQTTTLFWFNPKLDYLNFMVPGILVLLVTLIGMFLSAINLVKEKEIGTIEQINVSPIRKYQFIVGKLLPFWALALFELALGLTIASLAFNIPIKGSILLIFLNAAIYLLVLLGIGLFISTVTNTQQQAMFLSWFFLVIFILMSGLFTPIESMPEWAQIINLLNPVAYFIKSMRMIMLVGSGFRDIWQILLILGIYAAMVLLLAVWRYRKVA